MLKDTDIANLDFRASVRIRLGFISGHPLPLRNVLHLLVVRAAIELAFGRAFRLYRQAFNR